MVVLIVIGVCGSGKTTIGLELSAKLNWLFEDADDHHSLKNITKMSQNIPLTDEDRLPWLQSLHKIIAEWIATDRNGIITCSGLKKSYRDILVGGEGGYLHRGGNCVLVYLDGSKETITERMKKRNDHFMPLGLLESQLSTLELPTEQETCITCNIDQSVQDIVIYIIEQTQLFLRK